MHRDTCWGGCLARTPTAPSQGSTGEPAGHVPRDAGPRWGVQAVAMVRSQLLGLRVWSEARCQFGHSLTPVLGPGLPAGSRGRRGSPSTRWVFLESGRLRAPRQHLDPFGTQFLAVSRAHVRKDRGDAYCPPRACAWACSGRETPASPINVAGTQPGVLSWLHAFTAHASRRQSPGLKSRAMAGRAAGAGRRRQRTVGRCV